MILDMYFVDGDEFGCCVAALQSEQVGEKDRREIYKNKGKDYD